MLFRSIGHNAYIQDERDRGTARRFVPFLGVGPHAVPSLGTAAALVALGVGGRDVTRTAAALSIGRTTLPVVDDGRVLLRYTGAYLPDARDTARRLYRTESAFDVLLSEEKASAGETPVIDPSVFKDKVVFVGVGAAGLHDVVVTPFTESDRKSTRLNSSHT